MRIYLFLFLFCFCRSRASANNSEASHEGQDTATSEGQTTTTQQPLSVLIFSSWFSGHQTHVLGIGEQLVRRGHKVSFLSTTVNGSNRLPHVPEKLGMTFVSAGPDPKTREQYERALSGLMGQSVLRQRRTILDMMQAHLYKIRVALDALNCSDWDIFVGDHMYSMNLARYLELKCGMRSVLSLSTILDYTSMSPPWSYPSNYLLKSSDDMTLYQRFQSLFYQFLFGGAMGTVFTKYCLAGNDTELWDVVYKDPYFFYPPDVLHPVLYYSVVGVEYAHPHYPNVHMVGPILLSGKATPLHDDHGRWLNSKQPGSVVYVSMGTTAVLTRDMAVSLIKGVEQTGYSMLWSLRQTNSDIIDGMELDKSRFLVSDWVSQVAALEHPAVGVAVLHCGSGGIHEALSKGVPIICIPYAFDQFSWAAKIQGQGLGVALYATDMTTNTVVDSINTVSGEEYREKVRKISKVLKHAGGSKKAAELVEYYAEVGYDHLRTAPVKYRWGWIRYYNLDMYCILTAVSFCAIFFCTSFCRMFCVGKKRKLKKH